MWTRLLLSAALLASAPRHSAAAHGALDFIFNDDFDTPSGPITAPENTWTFVPFEDSRCANGTPTGIGVNLSSLDSRVLIFLFAGGACWDNTTCYVLNTASNITSGYDAQRFANDSAGLDAGFFDRQSGTNPFKDFSYVVVPYCTGDGHGGDNVAQYSVPTHHVGYRNMGLYLARLARTFPQAQRVFLAGASAGGFGAVFNWGQAQQAFGSRRVDLIDDSGPFMPPNIVPPSSPAEVLRQSNWNLATALPDGCTSCATDATAIYTYYSAQFPNNRGALLSYTADNVLPSYCQISSAQFTTGLNAMLANRFVPTANLKYFVASGSGHVLFLNPAINTGGTTLAQFLGRMVNDDPTWSSVQPP